MALTKIPNSMLQSPGGGGGSSVYCVDVRSFGAVGNGSTDDTVAFQSAITSVQLTGGILFISPGSYKITAPLNITSAINIQGAGYTTDTINLFGTTGYLSSTIIAYNTTVFNIVTDHPVRLENFGITYNQSPAPATSLSCIVLDTGNTGSVHANKESVFRDLFIIGPGVGVTVNNALGFTFDHVHIEGAKQYSMILRDINYPGSGDSNIINCTFSSSGVASHLLVQSGGGLRITNNKLNSCRNGGQLIFINPNLNTSEGISPLLINDNSLEFTSTNGINILFQRNVGTEVVGNLVIVGNELACSGTGTQGIVMQDNGATPWILSGIISGNFIYSTSYGMLLGGAKDLYVAGNMVSGAGNGYATQGVSTNVVFGGNGKGIGVA